MSCKIIHRFLPILFLLPVVGCASIVDGTHQIVSVQTTTAGDALSGAQCTLKSDKGTWFVNTPGTVTVHRGYDALDVDCKKTGYQPKVIAVNSSTKGMAFGNILFGGLIGAGVDMSDGAAYDYPNLITVPMQPVATVSAAPAPAATAASTQPVD